MKTRKLTYYEVCNRLLCGFATKARWGEQTDTELIVKDGACVDKDTGRLFHCGCGCKEDRNWLLVDPIIEHKENKMYNSYDWPPKWDINDFKKNYWISTPTGDNPWYSAMQA